MVTLVERSKVVIKLNYGNVYIYIYIYIYIYCVY